MKHVSMSFVCMNMHEFIFVCCASDKCIMTDWCAGFSAYIMLMRACINLLQGKKHDG